jgi:hypothetical protein
MLLRPSASQNPPANFTFKTSSVATAVTLSIVFLPPIGDTCKSHVKVHGHSDKMYHQLMATQVKLSKEVSGHRGSSRLYARFTLGVRDQKTCGQLWAFLACCWSQVTNKCYNIDVRILINAGTWAPRVANWVPKFDGILFSALGSLQGYEVQHLLVTWGRLKMFFLFQPWS